MKTELNKKMPFGGCSLKDFGMIAVGSFLLSLGVSWFADPAGLVVGGTVSYTHLDVYKRQSIGRPSE